MKLKLVIDSLDGLDESLKGLYTRAADGKYHLETEEDEDGKKKLQEFRDNNIKLMKDLEALKEQFKGVDPAKYKEFEQKMQELADKKMIEEGKLEELLQQRTERMRTDFDNQLEAMKKALDEKDGKLTSINARLSEVLIDGEIMRAISKVGAVRKEALRDVISRGRETWKLDENGTPVPMHNGKILYGKDGKEPMNFDEWAKVTFETASFLFEGSAGGGAGGGNGNGAGSTSDLAKLPPQERLNAIRQQGGVAK